jgi:hypothetical protein
VNRFRYIRLLTNVLEWQKKHQQQATLNNTNNVCNKDLEVQVKCEAPLCNISQSNGTCTDGAMVRLQQSIRCRHHRHTHHLLMLKAPLVCDRNGNNLLMVESASPFVSSSLNNKIHKSNQGNTSVFPRPQIKVEKDDDTTKDEEDLKVEDFAIQKSNSAADDKLHVSIAPRMPALGRTNVSNPHVTGGRRTSTKLTRNVVPAAFTHQQMRNKRTRTPTGDVRDVQCWASNFQPENDNKNTNKE